MLCALKDLDLLERITAFELLEKDGVVSPRAMLAFRIRFLLGHEGDSSRMRAFVKLSDGEAGREELAELIEEVEDAWRARQGDNGQG